MPLDRIDIAILETLQRDGRTSNNARRIRAGSNPTVPDDLVAATEQS
ncbi:AsnC family transcriptional regulator [Mesorhizobium sp. M0833]